jgi:hypothetical protein
MNQAHVLAWPAFLVGTSILFWFSKLFVSAIASACASASASAIAIAIASASALW